MAKRPKVSLSQPIQPQTGELEKLFSTAGDVEQASGLQLLAIRMDAIQPDPEQPRRTFPEGSLQELSDSIRQDGVIQPIEVTEVAVNKYMIVHGERRWRAAQMAGLETIPAVVRRRDYDTITRFVRQLVENIQREDLNDVDRAAGLLRLRDLLQEELDAAAAARQKADSDEDGSSDQPWANKVTWAKVGKRLGYSRQRIHQLIQLLRLPDEIKEAVREGTLSERDTRIYQGLKQGQQRSLHRARMAGELSPAEVKRVARQLKYEPERSVAEVIDDMRRPPQRPETTIEPAFDSSFDTEEENGVEKARRPPLSSRLSPVAPVAETDSRWVERNLTPTRKNAQNINRVHWARDHLARIQLQDLSAKERKALCDVLIRLQEDLNTLVDSLSAEQEA